MCEHKVDQHNISIVLWVHGRATSSVLFFGSYLGELVDMLKNNYGIFITEELSHLKILFYADYKKWGLL